VGAEGKPSGTHLDDGKGGAEDRVSERRRPRALPIRRTELRDAPDRGPSGAGRDLLKECVFDIATVVDALRRIIDAETVIDPRIVSRLLGRQRKEDPLAQLTAREREVLALIAEGMSNKAVAARLFVTERTVEAHVTQIFQKLGLTESTAQHREVLAVLTFLRA